ncbi:hypothetical protein D6851_00060 [Altericroceibacterium spongiae]|uniref:Uncharacterized protein n=1 Tax=Altericroceibacterium spongiae TaxID=2320269 RepID=A0A420EQK4_9SPHN|nr:hypothetical protein D6851_00060 [Altericroceibacterium spongiae]
MLPRDVREKCAEFIPFDPAAIQVASIVRPTTLFDQKMNDRFGQSADESFFRGGKECLKNMNRRLWLMKIVRGS